LLIIGSRGSQLALWQAHRIQTRLASLGHTSEIRIIKTTGDKILDVPLNQVGTKGLFTKEIEEALLAGDIDLAVHSLKDLPTELPAGLTLAAIPEREDPRDCIVGSTLAALPPGARVGTSSLRRTAQLRALRSDVALQPIRGNVDTRLRKLAAGEFDAILLAAAGLHRLGLQHHIAEAFEPSLMVPAVGQGALAIETRDDHGPGFEVARALHDLEAGLAIRAERAALAAMGGGCQVPLGAYAQHRGASLILTAVIAAPDGSTVLRHQLEGPAYDPESLGRAAAQFLLDHGARAILDAIPA
jgi:hydroxymethylbilane synthase